MSERLSIVIPKRLKQKIDRLKERIHLDQSSIIRIVLEEGIQAKQYELALHEYQTGAFSLGQAVALAETDYWTFLDLLHRKRIPLVLDEDDQIAEIQRIESKDYHSFTEKKDESLKT